MKHTIAVILLALLALGPNSLHAKDHELVERDMPVQLEDAYVAAYRSTESYLPARWERRETGEDQISLLPRFELGIYPNAEVSLAVPIFMGEAGTEESGDIEVGGTYNFNIDGIYVPAASIAGAVRAPTGKDSDVTETELELLLTKALFPSSLYHHVHVNLSWHHLSNESDEQRNDRLVLVAGYSQRLGSETLGIIDYIYEQERERGRSVKMLEAGLRYQLSPRWIIAAGGGVGLSNESPDGRVTAGVQAVY